MKVSYIWADNIRPVLLFIVKTRSLPFLLLLYIAMILYTPFIDIEHWIKEKLFWKIQGKSTDFYTRQEQYFRELKKSQHILN